MTNEITIETTIAVRHVSVTLACSFENARAAFETVIPDFDARIPVLLQQGEVELANEELDRGPELAIFQRRDHGSVLQIAGQAQKALQYDIGNPLTASKMTRHRLPAALYAPFRVLLYENPEGDAVFEYDKPSSLFGQFGDPQVTAVALGLDAAIERSIRQVGEIPVRDSDRSCMTRWMANS